MAVVNSFLGLAIVYLTFVLSSVSSEDVCVKRTPCSCVFPNGTGIDLAPAVAAGTGFYSAPYFVSETEGGVEKYQLITYYYHPCTNVPMNHTPSVLDSCDVPLSVYREVVTMLRDSNASNKYTLKEKACNFLGKSEEMRFANNSRSITYLNGPSDTQVLLNCIEGDSAGDNRLQVTSLADPQLVLLSFYSSHACLKQIDDPVPESGRSFGSTLLIVFFSFVVFYLVLGVCTKKFLMGATGVEVIPNLGFWTDLPNLVRDGWAFAINGFKLPTRGVGPTASPDPNSYDSI